MASTSSSEHKPAGLPVPHSTSSFWHSEPNQFLLNHRTTPELPAEADFVIVGSGITGASAARFLAEDERANGKTIVLLEAREACWGATGRNGGHCQVLPVARNLDVTQFEVLNYNAVKAYIEENDVQCEWRSLDGCRSYYSPDMFATAQAEVAALQKKSPELGKIVRVVTDPAELAKHRISQAVGCTLTSAAASLWPYKLITFILEKLVKSGRLNLQTNTPVDSITSAEESDAAASSHPHVLHTPRGAVRARNVILATNGYTSHLLPEFADLIVPVRGEMSALLPPARAPRLADSYGLCGQAGQPSHSDDYLNQRPYEGVPNPAGHYMYGGADGAAEHERVGVWDDGVVDEGMAAWLRRRLLQYMELGGETTGLEELRATHQWTGIMGYSRDNVPWVGKVPGKGLWLAGGYTGHGMPNGTLCGKAVVELALADEAGVPTSEAQQKVVDEVGLPKGYLITEDRFAEARRLPTVAEADALGVIGNHARQEAEPQPRRSSVFEYLKSFVTSSS